MAKLSPEVIERIKKEAERMSYGKITIVLSENSPMVDILVEERLRYGKDIPPGPGKVVVKGPLHQG